MPSDITAKSKYQSSIIDSIAIINLIILIAMSNIIIVVCFVMVYIVISIIVIIIIIVSSYDHYRQVSNIRRTLVGN